MPEPIANFSPEAVIQAIETNLVHSTLALGRGEDAVVFRGSDAVWVYTGQRGLSRVLQPRFLVDEAEDRVASIVACFQRWNAQVSWFIGPTSFPPEIPEYLRDAGFAPSEIWMGTARGLATLPESQAPAKLRVEVISKSEDFEAWTSLSTEHWKPADDASKIFTPEIAGSDPACRFYLGFIGNEPVVRGMTCVRGETAGLYYVSTRPSHRNRGFEVLLATRALLDARGTGARLGVMPVRGLSNPLCSLLEFHPYCQFQVFTWPAAAGAPLC
jgi:GNAT superfamily N-acetyltransferase